MTAADLVPAEPAEPHDATDAEDLFGPVTQAHGVFSLPGLLPRVGVRLHDSVVDVGALARRDGLPWADALASPSLNPFMALGPDAWAEERDWLSTLLTDPGRAVEVREASYPLGGPAPVALHLPVEVADYVDFYASREHASNLGAMFRPGQPALTPNWTHLPIGYHGRSGTVVVSGTPVRRPVGQVRPPGTDEPQVVASRRLDIEAEVGFVVGAGSPLGEPVGVADLPAHVFGVCLVNDWSARDLQAWEYVPLGPFLGKSFATTTSAWVTPLASLAAARVAPPAREHAVQPYLDDAAAPWGLDLRLEVRLNGHVVSRPPFAGMYWTAAQQLAHMTVNGASTRTGDLFASGTVSGAARDERGSLIELTWNGEEPLVLPDGTTRAFLEDGDEVVLRGWAPGPDGARVGLGEVSGRVLPARALR
ncbi:fumarylacetoacetase [Aquipuribacter nitratireducens]|uniref:fumarylacetoacetase n=1 Tax=Aquipuribacter nitratireducens TaxID=650104 RepID=A0ABW0GN71_9MICO